MRRIDRQHHAQKIGQRMPEPGIGQLIPGSPTLRHRHHQAAAAKARQMIRQRLPGHPQRIGQVGRYLERARQLLAMVDLVESGGGQFQVAPDEALVRVGDGAGKLARSVDGFLLCFY